MKKILSLLSIIIVFSLSGCMLLNPLYSNDSNNKQTQQTKTEAKIDYKSIADDIYSKVYEKVEAELYDRLYDEIRSEYLDGHLDIEELQQLIYKVVRTASEGNVGVSNMKTNESGEDITYATGSGVIYDKLVLADEGIESDLLYRYYLITNEHVVEGGNSYRVTFADESSVSATLVAADKTTDIAVVYFDSNLTYTVNPLGDSDSVNVGEIVLAIGNPKGETLFGSVTLGIIGGKDRNLLEDGTRNTINKYLQHDAAINSGNSGGGLFNLKGECIGINSVKYAASDIEGLNFSIPINLAKEVATQLREQGYYDGKVSLGVTVSNITDLTQEGRTKYNVPSSVTEGVIIITVQETGSAYGSLEAYDIVKEMDGVVIKTSNDIASVLSNHRLGETINIIVLRNGVETTVTVTFKR